MGPTGCYSVRVITRPCAGTRGGKQQTEGIIMVSLSYHYLFCQVQRSSVKVIGIIQLSANGIVCYDLSTVVKGAWSTIVLS